MSSYVPFVSKNAVKPYQFSAATISILTAFKNGPYRPVHSAGTINSRQLLSFVKNAISAKVCGFVLYAGLGFVVGPIMIFWGKIRTFMTILNKLGTVCLWSWKLSFYLTPKYQRFCIKNSIET
jgi:hypothetical protein